MHTHFLDKAAQTRAPRLAQMPSTVCAFCASPRLMKKARSRSLCCATAASDVPPTGAAATGAGAGAVVVAGANGLAAGAAPVSAANGLAGAPAAATVVAGVTADGDPIDALDMPASPLVTEALVLAVLVATAEEEAARAASAASCALANDELAGNLSPATNLRGVQ